MPLFTMKALCGRLLAAMPDGAPRAHPVAPCATIVEDVRAGILAD